ncbi:MAG: hypothetical protein DSY33_00645 [Archaeoglobus sp.]|jgi:uncharacterized membrane protein|nr:MAG: hypothetical protein DSY33_00645 [Archaeoglobus sp.]
MSKLSEIRNTFLTGLLILIPLATTAYIVYWTFNTLDSFMRPELNEIFGFYIPGMSLITLTAIILLLGVFGRLTVGRRLIEFIESKLMKVPVIRTIYSATKEASKAILVSETEKIKGVVLVEYPRKGVYAIGFTTGGKIPDANVKTGKRLLNVFIPTSPNPTSGLVILVPEDELIYLNISVEDALRIIMSGGFTKL